VPSCRSRLIGNDRRRYTAGLRLSGGRWNQTERDWRHFLTEAPDGALVAEEDGRVIGTAATLPYGPFAWISMVLVDPAARGVSAPLTCSAASPCPGWRDAAPRRDARG
jgi:hypothetical protein